MRRMLRLVTLAMVAASVALLGGVATAAGAVEPRGRVAQFNADDLDNFDFESLDVDYTLGRAEDGTSTLKVVETFVAVFPDFDQNHGMRRAIPDTYNGQPLFPSLQSITDENGEPRPQETDTDDGYFSMTSADDDFVRGRETYVFTYTLRNVTWTFGDTNADEFYWDVNGDEWAQAFGQVSARVHVPDELASELTGEMSCYVGERGSTDACDITQGAAGDETVVEAASSGLQPRQTMTIAIGFEAETFTPFDSSYLASPWGWMQGVAGLGTVGAILTALFVRKKRLSDEPGRPTIIAEYTAPPGMDALESAILFGRPDKAIPAEVLEQAVAGSIRILEGPKKAFGGPDLQAELIDPSRADGDGRVLLKGLFPSLAPGSVFTFGTYNKKFSSAAQSIMSEASAKLLSRGLQRPVSSGSRVLPILLAMGALALTVLFGLLAIGAGVAPLVVIITIMLAFVGVFVAVGLVVRKPLTAVGAEVRDHLKGLKLFIEWAEADRIRMLQSPSGAERVQIDPNDPRQMLKLYETLLPFAVVFGHEKEWAQRLIDLGGGESPSWYSGSAAFNAGAFSASIGSLSASASSSSSSSGGSSGGGSAGGGGGGGGGGGV